MNAPGEERVEEWRPVRGYEGAYEVSSFARVRSLLFSNRQVKRRLRPTPKIVTTHPQSNGYLGVCLSRDNRRSTHALHVLVLEAFRCPRPVGHEGAHVDGDVLNCRPENLLWATRGENERHKRDHGTMTLGTRNPKAKLTDAAVRESDDF